MHTNAHTHTYTQFDENMICSSATALEKRVYAQTVTQTRSNDGTPEKKLRTPVGWPQPENCECLCICVCVYIYIYINSAHLLAGPSPKTVSMFMHVYSLNLNMYAHV